MIIVLDEKTGDKWQAKSQRNLLEMFKEPWKLVLQNVPRFCDSSSLLISDSKGISLVTVVDPGSNAHRKYFVLIDNCSWWFRS